MKKVEKTTHNNIWEKLEEPSIDQEEIEELFSLEDNSNTVSLEEDNYVLIVTTQACSSGQ